MRKSFPFVNRWAGLFMMVLALSGCWGSGPEPTPTPTKTPVVAGQAEIPTPNQPASDTQPATGGQPAAEAPQATATPTPEPPKTETIGVVTADLLNIRNDPSTSGALVGTATTGQRFAIVGRNQDGTWLQIAEEGRLLGWVSAEFIDVQQVAVAPDQPATGGSDQPAGEQPAATPTAPPVAASFPPATMLSPDFGAQAFLWWRPEVSKRDLQLMREAGFNWVKQTFAWETIEGAGKGQYDWGAADRVVSEVNASGLKLLARVSSDPDLTNFWAGHPPGNASNFADFVFALASRYNCQPGSRGCIQAYQVWNEPNLAREWGNNRPNPAQYVEFLRQAYSAIKRANPNAIVISAGMAPTGSNDNNAMPDDIFYEEMYRAMGGNSNCCFDMLGVHGAGFAAPPETDPAEAVSNPAYGGYRFFTFRHVEDIRAIMVRYGDANKKVVLLEFGWTFDPVNPAYKWHGADAGIDQFVQGDYLKRAYQYAAQNWQPWIALMNLLTMPNLDWIADGNASDEEQYWWAIMEPSPVNEKNFRAAYIILCDYFNRQRGQTCIHDPALNQ
ncbi:MAG: hypothetical protein DCC55_15115 [Chloroflexi bacterium]|nr:MAG: hypothetical protein DCC55_15115 [Chloroflexota bacterium]